MYSVINFERIFGKEVEELTRDVSTSEDYIFRVMGSAYPGLEKGTLWHVDRTSMHQFRPKKMYNDQLMNALMFGINSATRCWRG